MNRGVNNPIQAAPVESEQDFDPIPSLDNWERITHWLAIGISAACTIGVAAGAMGYAYVKWIA